MDGNTLKDMVEHYLTGLSSDQFDNSWHSLVELGPAALPYLTEAFRTSRDRSVAVALVRVVKECRTSDAVRFLSSLLQETDPDIWKTALDGLITIGDAGTVTVLLEALNTLRVDKRTWVREAIDQVGPTAGETRRLRN